MLPNEYIARRLAEERHQDDLREADRSRLAKTAAGPAVRFSLRWWPAVIGGILIAVVWLIR